MASSQSTFFTKLTTGFTEALDSYRQRIASADAKDRQTPATFSIENNFNDLRLTLFQQALIFYTATLLYTGDTDDLLAGMYKQFDALMTAHPLLEQTFSANPDIVANRHVLHLDPCELVTPLLNPDAHYLLDANQLLVIKTYDEIFAMFKTVNGFQNMTPIIMGYLAHAFYLPTAESRSKEVKDAAFRERLLTRQVQVKAYDHILAPFHESRKENIVALFERALVNFDECYEQVYFRVNHQSYDEIEIITTWTDKLAAKDADTLTLNEIKLQVCLMNSYARKMECMQQLIKLKNGLVNCTFTETVMFYHNTIWGCRDLSEQTRLRSEYKQYLQAKIAEGNILAHGYLGRLLYAFFEDPAITLQHLKKAQHICLTTTGFITNLIEQQRRNKEVKYHIRESLTRNARKGNGRSLRILGGGVLLGEEKQIPQKNPVYLAEASRFCHGTAFQLAEEKLQVAMENKCFAPREFAEMMMFYERAIARDYQDDTSLLACLTVITNWWQHQPQEKRQKMKALFDTLSLAERVKMLYVAVFINDRAPLVKNSLIAMFNTLAREDGALELLADPMRIWFLDQAVKDKFAARGVAPRM